MVNEFTNLVFKFNPQGYDVELFLSGETWLAQFFFIADNLHKDINAIYIFAIILYLVSAFSVNVLIKESR